MKFKVGDRVRAIDDFYAITNKSNNWEGIVTEVHQGFFKAKRTSANNLVYTDVEDTGLAYSKFELIPPFRKTDLKNGDVVTLRNGDKLIYSETVKEFIDISNESSNFLIEIYDLDDTMKFATENTSKPGKCDVVKVERPIEYETVFLREEIKEMTKEEIEKELGYKIRIIDK